MLLIVLQTVSPLAFRAVAGGTPAKGDGAQGGPATGAGCAGLAVDDQFAVEGTLRAVHASEIRDGGSSGGDGACENRLDFGDDAVAGRMAEAVGAVRGTHACGKEALGGIDVTHAGDHGVVHEEFFHGDVGVVRRAIEHLAVEVVGQWLRPQEIQHGREAFFIERMALQESEAARVFEAECEAVVQFQNHVFVLSRRLGDGGHTDRASHSEVQEQSAAVVQGENIVSSSPINGCKGATCQFGGFQRCE